MDPDAIAAIRTHDDQRGLSFFGETPYVYHCHHYNLFHDQTIDDVLGEERGTQVRTAAARDAFRQLLDECFTAAGAQTPAERIGLAQTLFAAMGHGKTSIEADADGGGRITGSHLHYGLCWREKYGQKVKRFDPADAVTAGFGIAAVELAHRLHSGELRAIEKLCIAQRDPTCEIELSRGEAPRPAEVLGKSRVGSSPAQRGLWEDQIEPIVEGLLQFLGGVAGDERGLVQAFNVFVTAHLSNYYNATIFEAMHELERTSPAVAGSGEKLFREAGHVCVFNTFGNILLSPEWESLVGPLPDDPEAITAFNLAIARSLGFGHWLVPEFEVGKRLVLRTTTNYEAPFYINRYGLADRPRCYVTEGAALAFAVLAHRVKWSQRPSLDQAFYDSLFRGAGLGWETEVVADQARGDDVTEIVVTKSS